MLKTTVHKVFISQLFSVSKVRDELCLIQAVGTYNPKFKGCNGSRKKASFCEIEDIGRFTKHYQHFAKRKNTWFA